MKRFLIVAPLILMLAAMLACNAAGSATLTSIPTLAPTNLPVPTIIPTVVEPTIAPTTVPPTVPPPTAIPATSPSTIAPTSTGVDRVKIYLAAMEDNGKSGDQIGCGDSIIAVERQIAPTQAPLRAALEELLSLVDQYYGESGLYNALYQSKLTVEAITIDPNGKAIIHLRGTLLSGGVCDDPRIIAQLNYTAKQFSTVKDTAIYVNGTLIQELLSGK
jgi:hypothetical protein